MGGWKGKVILIAEASPEARTGRLAKRLGYSQRVSADELRRLVYEDRWEEPDVEGEAVRLENETVEDLERIKKYLEARFGI